MPSYITGCFYTILYNWLFYIFQQGGLHPTSDQIELFAYHLPHATLCNLIVSILSRTKNI